MIWVSCCHQDKQTEAKENLKLFHSVVDVSPFELLSTMTGHELIFLEVVNSSSEGFELLQAVKNRFPFHFTTNQHILVLLILNGCILKQVMTSLISNQVY